MFHKLLIPGPVNVDEKILLEMSHPMTAHYGHEWIKVYDGAREKLKKIIGTKGDIFLLVGSGHSGLDAIIGNVVEEDDKVLNIVNGYFGNRCAEITELYGANSIRVESEWGKSIDCEKIVQTIKKEKNFKLITVVHNETSTGVINPIKEISRIANEYGIPIYVDGVSSIGAMEFKMDEWGIDFCSTASQKGLGAPPGIAVVCVANNGWDIINKRKKPYKGWYLNLLLIKELNEKGKGWQPYGVTMALNNVRALNKAADLILEEGLNKRINRHYRVARDLRKWLRGLNLEILAEEDVASNTVTVIKCTEIFKYKEVSDYLLEKHNIQVARGNGLLIGKVVRIGHMGVTANYDYIIYLIYAIADFINSKGYDLRAQLPLFFA